MLKNEIVIDPEAILKLEDGCIDEPFLIRQIALFGLLWENKDDPRTSLMNKKIDQKFAFTGLYPHMLTLPKEYLCPNFDNFDEEKFKQCWNKVSEDLVTNRKQMKAGELQILHGFCGATTRYMQNDITKATHHDYGGGLEIYYYIRCSNPNCKERILEVTKSGRFIRSQEDWQRPDNGGR